MYSTITDDDECSPYSSSCYYHVLLHVVFCPINKIHIHYSPELFVHCQVFVALLYLYIQYTFSCLKIINTLGCVVDNGGNIKTFSRQICKTEGQNQFNGRDNEM